MSLQTWLSWFLLLVFTSMLVAREKSVFLRLGSVLILSSHLQNSTALLPSTSLFSHPNPAPEPLLNHHHFSILSFSGHVQREIRILTLFLELRWSSFHLLLLGRLHGSSSTTLLQVQYSNLRLHVLTSTLRSLGIRFLNGSEISFQNATSRHFEG